MAKSNLSVQRLINLWHRSGCFEPGEVVSAEAEIAHEDAYYDKANPRRRPPGVRAVFLEGPVFEGRPTRVFAWVGVPRARGKSRQQGVPGMVLAHGGGGTAFAGWVAKWVRRGYAAIAIDTCGNLPRAPEYRQWHRHEHAGPAGWGGFDQTDRPIQDQWPFHAVAAVVRAHSYLRSLNEVDERRIGMSGISWGGYLACITSAVDDRFRFVNPVYGCGYYNERPRYGVPAKPVTPQWMRWWDPSVYLPHARVPMLWLTGTNDIAFPLALWERSHALTRVPKTLCLKVNFHHSHQFGWRPREIAAYADSVCRNAPGLVTPRVSVLRSGQLKVRWSGNGRIRAARLCYASDDPPVKSTAWKVRSIPVGPGAREITIPVPSSARVAFVNLTDARRLMTSTELVYLSR